MAESDKLTDRPPRTTGDGSDAPPTYGDPLSDIERRARASAQPSHDEAHAHTVIGSTQPAAITGIETTPPVLGSGISLSTGGSKIRLGDRVFGYLTAGSGAFIVVLIGLVALFLVIKAVPAITHDKVNFLSSRHWDTTPGALDFGVLPLLWTTVLASVIALLIAVPIAIGIALFISQYAPARLARPVGYVIDLLAAIPSIIYGVWGITILGPQIQPVANFLTKHLGWFPLFADKHVDGGTVFTGGVVLSIMILPIITAVSRDVFDRTPQANMEAAWALGATRWEMIRMSVLPYGRAGAVSGAMLGLGRALGETIAITLILSKVSNDGPWSWSIFDGGETFASKIANNSPEFNTPAQTGAYITAGLVLFVLTFVVNAAARVVVNRGVKG